MNESIPAPTTPNDPMSMLVAALISIGGALGVFGKVHSEHRSTDKRLGSLEGRMDRQEETMHENTKTLDEILATVKGTQPPVAKGKNDGNPG